MDETKCSFTLETNLESVNKADEAVRRLALSSGIDQHRVDQIAAAVREATANAVLHGNQCDPSKRVSLAAETNAEVFTVTVRDEGPGLDPSTIPDPTAPENLTKPSGRGVFLMRAFMDEVHFRNMNPGTEITIIKRIGGNANRGGEASK